MGTFLGIPLFKKSQESKSAEAAVSAQERVAIAQIQAAKDSEIIAQDTATKQLKAARARKSSTILTSPLGAALPEGQVNQPTVLGVPS